MFTAKDRKKRWFVTGGAGFIGSHVVDVLMKEQCRFVTVYDNLSSGKKELLEPYRKNKNFRFYHEDLLKLKPLVRAIKGHDIVWHLAANTDIPGGYTKTDMDIKNCTVATYNVLEAMRQTNISPIIFASTGAVYGESITWPAKEHSGPLIPVSLYGAGKISSEAYIAAYASLYGIQAWVFRFGNVIGKRMSHGVIYDFIQKLRKDPHRLIILGDGKQRKNYFLVEECIDGMLYCYHRLKNTYNLINLGAETSTNVQKIAKIIIQEMGLKDVRIIIEGSPRAWPGDQPKVFLSVRAIRKLGWRAKHASDQAVRIATRRYLGKHP